MAIARPPHPLQIGEFVLDPSLNELRHGDAAQRLPSRLTDLLLRLAAEPDRLVRRETLLDEVWERRQVNDEVLSRAIADLRQALRDDARAPRYIETLPKLGYRLVAPVASVAAAAAADALATGGASMAATAAATPEVAATDIVPTHAEAPPTRRRPLMPAVLASTAIIAVIAAALLVNRANDRLAAGTTATPAPATDPLTAINLLRARPFTTDSGRELFPRFTPDARWVVYTHIPASAQPAQPAQLRLRAVDGTEDRALVADDSDNFCGSVSPDGRTLAWLRLRPGVCELSYRAMLGGPVRVLAGCDAATSPTCPDWSPDGQQLVLAGDAQRPGLIAVDFPEGTSRLLTRPPQGQRDLMPRFRRDGGTLVFWRGDGQARRLYSIDLRDGREQALRDTAQLGFGHAFAADGTLLLADDSHGQRALLRLTPDRGTTTLLGGSDARHPDIAINGALVFEVARYDANLWRIHLRDAASAPRQLTTSARYDSQPVWSPDGSRIAFVSNRDGREGVYLIDPAGGEERKLPLDPALRWTSPAWSPDGNTLLVLRYDGSGAQFCLHTLASAHTHCRADLGRNRHGGFFLDAQTLAAVDADAAAPSLWRIALDGGSAPQRDQDMGAVDRCAATADWLVCHRPGRRGLLLQDRRDGRRREIAPDVGEEFGSWTLQRDAVWFATREDTQRGLRAGIHRVDLRSGEQQFVTPHRPGAIGASIAVAPDGTSLVLARTDGLDTELMYVPPPDASVAH